MTEDRLLIEELAAKGGQPDFLRTIAENVEDRLRKRPPFRSRNIALNEKHNIQGPGVPAAPIILKA